MIACFSASSLIMLAACMGADPEAATSAQNLRADAASALHRACSYYHDHVASHGGYVYYYSADLHQRWGEGKASADTIFVQPPGTPTVGLAYLRAYGATGKTSYLDAARDAAYALVYGQLESGGWTQVIHFPDAKSPAAKRLGKYRSGHGGSWNTSSLDDGQTQSALLMLVRADEALGFHDSKIHEAAIFGLDCLLGAQFPNGGFPQVWTGPVRPQPVTKAKFPDYNWRSEGRLKNYWDYYTLNDGLAGTVSAVLIEADRVYRDSKYRAALEKLGDFLILAQMPDPQPGWCQQYSYAMEPIWARKFEPPAITGWESQDVLETLIKIARRTNQAKYLEPIGRAIKYYKSCLLPDGQIARYYELKTNKPLYMNASYELTYDDSDVPPHYGWKQTARFDAIEKSLAAVKRGKPLSAPRDAKALEAEVRAIIDALDAEGRWISNYAGERLVGQPKFPQSFRYISSDVFSRHVQSLSEYLAPRNESNPDQ